VKPDAEGPPLLLVSPGLYTLVQPWRWEFFYIFCRLSRPPGYAFPFF
jgi:hypothetical protein